MKNNNLTIQDILNLLKKYLKITENSCDELSKVKISNFK